MQVFRHYWVRGVFTWAHGIPQHYKDVHVIAHDQEDAKQRAARLDTSMRVAKRVYVQSAH